MPKEKKNTNSAAANNSTATNNSKHGGARPGAGRPTGSGRYNEPTKAIRVPEGSIPQIKHYLSLYPDVRDVKDSVVDYITPAAAIAPTTADNIIKLEIPLFSSSVAAGFPSPAEDHIEDTLDLNDYMVERPDSTFMLRVEGESMKDAGILPNDILVVDRSLAAAHNKIVIAAIDGQLTVKKLFHRGGLIKLLPENINYPEIELDQESDLVIWGVVIGSFRRFQSF